MEGKSLSGHTALVTGAGRGIGRAIALRLAAQGANVVVNYSHSAGQAEMTVKECAAFGVKTMAVKADISRKEECRELFAKALSLTGKLEILVCNAGVTRDALSLRMKEEDFDLVQRINLYGTFFCIQQAERVMIKERYGRIICLSSVVGLHGNIGQVNYAASKAGVIGMTKSFAKELAGRGITVNAVAPGMVETEMTAAMTQQAREQMISRIPAGRMGRPEEIAEAAVWLAGPGSSYITGQVVSVDGGMGC